VCSFEMDHIWYYKNAVFFFLLGKCLSLSLIPFSRGKRSAIGLMNSSNDHFYYDKYYNLSPLSPPLSLSLSLSLSHTHTHTNTHQLISSVFSLTQEMECFLCQKKIVVRVCVCVCVCCLCGM